MVTVGVQAGESGEPRLGSVLRRTVGGFWVKSGSKEVVMVPGVLRRSEGTGGELKASRRSVSGTGSMVERRQRHMAWREEKEEQQLIASRGCSHPKQ
jgi:hypothetical protein